MTDRLYYRDAELLEFDANVVGFGVDAQHVLLDRTAFYPTSGGQQHDTGKLGDVRVIDVIDADDHVVHVTDTPVKLGAIHGRIDAARRRDHMEQHTAQHLLSAIAADRFKWETVSVHFGAEHSTIEFATASAGEKQLASLEAMANDAAAAAHHVTVGFEDSRDAAARGLRKPSALEGEIRVITIDGLDRSACGGTHVNSTAAFAPIMLAGVEQLRGNTRVGFRAGGRARRHAREQDALLAKIAGLFSCSVAELEELVPKRMAQLREMTQRTESLEIELATAMVRGLVAGEPAGEDGVTIVTHRDAAATPTMMRALTKAASGYPALAMICVAGDAVHLVAGTGTGVNAGQVMKTALAVAQGRGGGSATVAQGTSPNAELLVQLILAALNR